MIEFLDNLNWAAIGVLFGIGTFLFTAGGFWALVLHQTREIIKRQDITNGSIVVLKEHEAAQTRINERIHSRTSALEKLNEAE